MTCLNRSMRAIIDWTLDNTVSIRDGR